MAAAKGTGILALIGGAPKPSEGGEGAEPSGEEMALRDMFDAAKAGDWSAATEAFRRAYDECSMRHDEDAESGDRGSMPPEGGGEY